MLRSLSSVAAQLWRRYGDGRKLANAARLQQQHDACAEVVTALPWRIILEPANVCNLRCVDCGTLRSDLPRGMLSPGDVARFLDGLWGSLVQVNLFHWGEPLLNPHVDEIVALIHRHGAGTQIHSNMNRLPEGLAERLIAAGLDFLVASVDGVTQDVYERYRRGGDVKAALANLRRFVEARRRLGSPTPRIIWRFLCFPHTLGEIAAARALARETGVDDFAVADGAWQGQWWTATGRRDLLPLDWDVRSEPPRPLCRDIYDFPVIHWDGTLMPCCYVSDRRFAWGDLKAAPWIEAFNTDHFRRARRFLAGAANEATPCAGCFKTAAAGLKARCA